MNLHVKAKRMEVTPSRQRLYGARAQDRRPESRPTEVPALNLKQLGLEDEDTSYIPASQRPVRMGPPDSSSTLSWGTAVSHPYQPSAWEEEHVVPENLPPPSERYKIKYKQYEAEIREDFRRQTQGTVNNVKDTSRRSSAIEPTQELVDQEDSGSPMCHTTQPYTLQHSMRKMEAEDVALERKKQAVVEQVMVDQLSRAVISDPDQNCSPLEHTVMPRVCVSPLWLMKRTLHETKVKTRSSLTENLLSNKLQFSARILSWIGRDACRELFGFFFTHDNTLTIYEYRVFGKNRMNALPFIPKACYTHQRGRRAGHTYSLHDFYVGADLSFSTHNLNLPEKLKHRALLWIRITDVDELARSMLMDKIGDVADCLSKEEQADRNTLMAIHEAVRKQLRESATCTFLALGRLCEEKEASGDGSLRMEEARRLLEHYQLSLTNEDVDYVWHTLRLDGASRVECDEFIRTVLGEMNEYRKAYVRKAYMKLDPTKSGSISLTDIAKFYSAKAHPKVLSGEATEETMRERFLQSFQLPGATAGFLSYAQFHHYYEGLSIGVHEDEEFAKMMRSAWSI